jgi:hypothetical protein
MRVRALAVDPENNIIKRNEQVAARKEDGDRKGIYEAV